MTDDEMTINLLINDSNFLNLVEKDYGKLARISADFKNNIIIYEFFDGSIKHSNISKILKKIEEINYLKCFEQ